MGPDGGVGAGMGRRGGGVCGHLSISTSPHLLGTSMAPLWQYDLSAGSAEVCSAGWCHHRTGKTTQVIQPNLPPNAHQLSSTPRGCFTMPCHGFWLLPKAVRAALWGLPFVFSHSTEHQCPPRLLCSHHPTSQALHNPDALAAIRPDHFSSSPSSSSQAMQAVTLYFSTCCSHTLALTISRHLLQCISQLRL